jgi:ribosomal protein S13
VAEDDSKAFDGPLKRDQVLVRDLVDGAYGIGPKLAARIHETSGIKSSARIADLSHVELERLADELRALLPREQRE